MIKKKDREGIIMQKKIILSAVTTGIFILTIIVNGFADDRKEVNICCYSVGSIQYIWSAQHAKLINKYSQKIKATASFCGAETATMKLLANSRTDFGESCAMEFEMAKRGEELYSRYDPAASKKKFFDPMAQVYHQPYGSMNFFVLDESPIKSLADVKGYKGSLSSAACTIGPICKEIFRAHGLEYNKDYSAVHYSCGSGQAPDALADRTLDFFECNNPGRQPSVENIHVQNEIRRLPFAPGKLESFFEYMDKKYGAGNHGLYSEIVEKGRYGKNDKTPSDIENVAYDLIITTRKDQDEEVVYEFVKALFDHLDEFHQIGAYSELVTLEKAVQHLHSEVPMHPGAARYFYEKGLLPKEFYKDLPSDIKSKLNM